MITFEKEKYVLTEKESLGRGKNGVGLIVSGLNHAAHSEAESMTDEGDGDPPVKMKPASSYDYTQGTIDGKFTDDWNYILNGGKGNPFSRYGEIFARDWNASSTSQKTDLALSATPLAFVRVGSLGLKTISFGRNANQTYHAFRHVDKLGLSRNVVIKAIEKHLPTVISKVKVGQPLNVVTKINNTRIQYSVYKVGNSYNIGRIHAAF